MRRRWRERPRLLAAQVALALVGLAAALPVASALAGDSRDRESTLEQRLVRTHERQRDHSKQLARAQAKNERLNGQLAALRRVSGRLARTLRALRGELTAARRALQRARAQ